VHGAVRDTLAYCREVFAVEMNSAVDNPLIFLNDAMPSTATPPLVGTQRAGVFADSNSGEILSGGNFHGEPLAFALDFMSIVLSALAGISERRVDRLVNPFLNEGLPPFLAHEAGLQSGLMMAQVTAAALASENKVLAHPASVDSITTSGNKEDYVSMGMAAANKLKRVVTNTSLVLAIEAIAAAQGLSYLLPLQPGKRGQAAVTAIRSVSPPLDDDRPLGQEFEKLAQTIRAGKLAVVLD
jgi:histidine ammonia-lyase